MESRFAQQLGRGGNKHDPELDQMREELDEYYRAEEKEQLRSVLEQKCQEHKVKQEPAVDHTEMAEQNGFVIDNRRSR